MTSEKISLTVNNMVCESCEKIIEKNVSKIHGVESVKASYSDSKVKVLFNSEKASRQKVISVIKEAGYNVESKESDSKKEFRYVIFGLFSIAFLLLAYLFVSSLIGIDISIPQLDAQTSIVLIFIVGLLTGFHCIGMCGGFVLSYTAKARKQNPVSLNLLLHGKYAFGKIISYSLIGGIFGVIGSFFVFTPELRAGVAIIAGLFLILFALKLLNIFPILRKLSLPQSWFDKFKIGPLKSGSNPFTVGLMNGLFIACGPLQAMYVIAATTGSFFSGALLLFSFAIGTLIPMLGFGVFASFMSHGFQNNVVRFSAVIVFVMGLLMINNGLALTGSAVSFDSVTTVFASNTNQEKSSSPVITSEIVQGELVEFQTIEMDVIGSGWSPNSFVLKKGIPVKWAINGKQINGCNNAIIVPAYGLEFDIKPGIQTIEFTPIENGVIQWSCWMGMIQGTFVVRDDIALNNEGKVVLDEKTQAEVNSQIANAPKPEGGCGCGGGSSCSAS
ncbi:MAG: sulfite exporter TauE/SafE family protein [Candidatus Diapherotrites archaeon]